MKNNARSAPVHLYFRKRIFQVEGVYLSKLKNNFPGLDKAEIQFKALVSDGLGAKKIKLRN